MQLEEGYLREVLTKFYERVVDDPLIGYLFWNVDLGSLVDKQVAFTQVMFGIPGSHYSGASLSQAHRSFSIRHAQYLRRRLLLKETLTSEGFPVAMIDSWLSKEDQLKKLILQK